MADPTNRADVPPSWLPEATEDHPKPPAYRREVARKIKNRRWVKVVDMAAQLEQCLAEVDPPAGTPIGVVLTQLHAGTDRFWCDLAKIAGHPSDKPPSPETRAAVIEKVRADLVQKASGTMRDDHGQLANEARLAARSLLDACIGQPVDQAAVTVAQAQVWATLAVSHEIAASDRTR